MHRDFFAARVGATATLGFDGVDKFGPLKPREDDHLAGRKQKKARSMRALGVKDILKSLIAQPLLAAIFWARM